MYPVWCNFMFMIYGAGTSFRTEKKFPSYRTAAAQCIDQFMLMAAQPLFGNEGNP
jgi:hypothetical protein